MFPPGAGFLWAGASNVIGGCKGTQEKTFGLANDAMLGAVGAAMIVQGCRK
jgi:hypothetical protein